MRLRRQSFVVPPRRLKEPFPHAEPNKYYCGNPDVNFKWDCAQQKVDRYSDREESNRGSYCSGSIHDARIAPSTLVGMDLKTIIKAIVVQAVAVALLSLALGVILPHSFFESYGWFAGPAAWMVCTLATTAATGLQRSRVLIGAALAGLPSLLAVAIGAHWLGAAIAVVLLGLWCGRLAEIESRAAWT